MTHSDQLVIRVATVLSTHLFGSSYRGLTPAAQEVARSEARRVLDEVVPLVLAEAEVAR